MRIGLSLLLVLIVTAGTAWGKEEYAIIFLKDGFAIQGILISRQVSKTVRELWQSPMGCRGSRIARAVRRSHVSIAEGLTVTNLVPAASNATCWALVAGSRTTGRPVRCAASFVKSFIVPEPTAIGIAECDASDS